MVNYPLNYDDEQTLPIAQNFVDTAFAKYYNGLREAILAIERTLGINPQHTYNSVSEILNLAIEHINSEHAPSDAVSLTLFNAHVNDPIHHNRKHSLDSTIDHEGLLDGNRIQKNSITIDKIDETTFENVTISSVNSIKGLKAKDLALSSHNHDDRYLELGGGILNGPLVIQGISDPPIIVQRNAPVCPNLNVEKIGGKTIDELLMTNEPGYITTDAGVPLTIYESPSGDILTCKQNEEVVYSVTNDLIECNVPIKCEFIFFTNTVNPPFNIKTRAMVKNLNAEFLEEKKIWQNGDPFTDEYLLPSGIFIPVVTGENV